jgi:hypothetical protein
MVHALDQSDVDLLLLALATLSLERPGFESYCRTVAAKLGPPVIQLQLEAMFDDFRRLNADRPRTGL